MSFNDAKISNEQIQQTGIQSQPDIMSDSAKQNKLAFDALPTLIIQKVNSLIDQLQQQAAAGQIGVTAFEGMTATNVQQALEELHADIGGNYGGIDGAGKVGYTPSEGVDASNVQAAIEAVQANLATYIAKIKAVTGAAEVGNAPIVGMTATNVQQALEELRENIDNIVSGVIPGGSITNDMLQGPVSVDKGGTGATTPQGALAALGAGVRPNELDNACFVGGGTGWGVFPVNQRGVSGTISTPGYFIDRWKLISGTVQITAAGLVLNGTIAQVLPAPIGNVYTATALTTTGPVTCQYDDASRTFSVTGTGQTFIFAKLEKGLGQTAAYQDADGTWNLLPQPDINYATQLLRCQQYFFACKDVLENFPAIMNGLAGDATIQTPVPMAKTPVFVKDGSSGYGVVYTSAGATGITNVSVYSSIGNHVTLTIATVSEIVANCVWRECAFALDTGM